MHYTTKHKLIIKIFSFQIVVKKFNSIKEFFFSRKNTMIFIFIKMISRIHVFWTFTCAIICLFVCYRTKIVKNAWEKNMEKEIPTTFRSFFLLIFIIRRRRI
jgi:hypothetical protein